MNVSFMAEEGVTALASSMRMGVLEEEDMGVPSSSRKKSCDRSSAPRATSRSAALISERFNGGVLAFVFDAVVVVVVILASFAFVLGWCAAAAGLGPRDDDE